MGSKKLFEIPKDFNWDLQRFADEGDVKDTGDEEKDLQKALDENLEAMNNLIKAKSKFSKKDIEEMMKDKESRKLAKEYMKKSDEGGGEEDEDEAEEEAKKEEAKKSFDDLDQNAEVVDAIPILKSFYEVQKKIFKKINEVQSKVEVLQKSLDDESDVVKSFADVLTSQSDLIKSINGDVEVIANQPLPRKGKIDKNDILKSGLESEPDKNIPVAKIKGILMKSYKDEEIEMSEIAKWEQSNFNLGVLKKSTLALIDSKLQ